MAFRNKEQSRTNSYHDDFSDCNSYKHRSVVSTKSESSLRRKNVNSDSHKGKNNKFYLSGQPDYSREREMENRRNQSCCCSRPQNIKYKRKPEDNPLKSDCKCLDCRIKKEKVTKTSKPLDRMDKEPKNFSRNSSKDPRKRISKQSDDLKKMNRSDKHVNYGHKCAASGKSGTRSHSCTSSCIDEKYYEKMRQKMWNDMMPEMERYVNKKMRAQNKHQLLRESKHKENMKSDLYSKISKNYSKLSEVTDNLKKCVDKGFLSLFKWADDISDRYSNRGSTTSDAGSIQSKVSDFEYTSCDNTSDEVLSATSSRLVTFEDPCNDDDVFIYNESCEVEKLRKEQVFETSEEELPTSPSSIVSHYSIPLVNISQRKKTKTTKYSFPVTAPFHVEDSKVMKDLSESLNADNLMAAFLQEEVEQSSLDSFTNNNFKGTKSMPIALSCEESKRRPYSHAAIDEHDIFDEKYDQSNFLSIGGISNPSHKSLRSESKFEIVESIRINKDCDSTSSATELASLLGDSVEITKAGTNLEQSMTNFTSNFIKRDEYLNSYASIRKDDQETTMELNEHLLHEDHVLNHSDEFLLVTKQETGAISKTHSENSANYRLSPDSGNASAFSSEIEPKSRTYSDSGTISTTWIGSDSVQRSGRLLQVNNDALSVLTGVLKPSLFFSNQDSGTCSSDEELHILAINRIENHQNAGIPAKEMAQVSSTTGDVSTDIV